MNAMEFLVNFNYGGMSDCRTVKAKTANEAIEKVMDSFPEEDPCEITSTVAYC